MSDEYIEISERTLDDCITAACRKLTVTSENLDYEVVDQGSLGFMGFNARNAVIRARVRRNEKGSAAASGDVLGHMNGNLFEEDVKEETPSYEEEQNFISSYDESSYDETKADTSSYSRSYTGSDFTRSAGRSSYGSRGRKDRSSYRDRDRNRNDRSDRRRPKSYDYEVVGNPVPSMPRKPEEPKVHFTQEQIAGFKTKADEFLQPMFSAMGMDVDVTYVFDDEENILNVNFDGDDMGVLIGKRGQTLDSIQYLVSLVVNKNVSGYVHVKADTENYRERRRRTLESLARNVASKVKRTHRAQALEPMNPYERRIIHSALQGDRYVTTYSEGEDPYRRVVIAPKRG